jgi:hypothetical protein
MLNALLITSLWFGEDCLKIVYLIGFAKIIVWSVILLIYAPNVLITNIMSTLFRISTIIYIVILARPIACLVRGDLPRSAIAGILNSENLTQLILILHFDSAYPS